MVRLGGRGALVDERTQVGWLLQIQLARAALGWVAGGVERVGDEGAVSATAFGLELGQGEHLNDNAAQLSSCLGAFDLRYERLAVEVIELLVQDGDEHHVLATGMLQVSQCSEHFLAQEAVGPAGVGLAGALRHRLRLDLGPDECQASQHRDAVDEIGVVLGQLGWVTVALTHMVEVSL